MNKNEHSLTSRFFILSVILFLIILIGGNVAFIPSMRQIILENKRGELSQTLEVAKIRLETNVNSEIAIVLKLASSPLVMRYFSSPKDPELERDAFEEIDSYRKAFLSNSIFWVNDKDKIFYSDSFESYIIDTNKPDNYWYNMTLYETDIYNFNINYNPDLNMTNLWINAPVFDDEGTPLGMVGTFINLSTFIDSVYEAIGEHTEFYFFNKSGEITGARDISLIESKCQIRDAMPNVDDFIFDEVKDIGVGEIRAYNISKGEAAINTIPMLDWYSIASMPNSLSDYNTAMTGLFVVMLLVILLIIIIFNVFINHFLRSLHKTTESLECAKSEAEAANELRLSFLSAISHEIRVPITETIGAIELRMLGSGMTSDMSNWLSRLLETQRNIRKRLDGILDEDIGSAEIDKSKYNFEIDNENHNKSASVSNPGGTRHLFVINPKSFITLKDLKDFLLSIEKCFSVGYRAEYKVYISRYPRDAYSAVHRYLKATPPDETARVYAVGGDGILFDCLNGLAKFPNAELAPIPYGNANDFVRAFGEENMNMFRDIKLMSKSPSRPVDAILCGQQYALGSCAIGIEAEAVQSFSNTIERINHGEARAFVPLLYKLGAVKSLFNDSQSNKSYRLTLDGKDHSGEYLLINIGNIALNGGSNIPNPYSVPDDGILDVITCKSSSAINSLRMLPCYTSGKFERLSGYMKHYRLKEVHCECDSFMSVVLDGETFYTNELDVKILPKAVKIVSPKGIGFADYSQYAKKKS